MFKYRSTKHVFGFLNLDLGAYLVTRNCPLELYSRQLVLASWNLANCYLNNYLLFFTQQYIDFYT